MYRPIFVDVNAKLRDYEKLTSEQLLVTSIFPTIQGEGPFAGKRCVFLRLAGCNYGSKGVGEHRGCAFCDTDFRLENGKVMDFTDIIQEIKAKDPNTTGPEDSLLVITGGEPLLQQPLQRFIREIYKHNFIVQIETNGLFLDEAFTHEALVVVSPKIPELYGASEKPKYHTIPIGCLKRMDYLKVIVSADINSPYHVLPGEALLARDMGKIVYISPINVYKKAPKVGEASIWDSTIYDHDACAENHNYAARLCQEHGFTLSMQKHLFCKVA